MSGDPDSGNPVYETVLLLIPAAPAFFFFVVYFQRKRRADTELRRRLSRLTFAGSLLILLWIDAAIILLELGTLLIPAALLTLAVLWIAPHGKAHRMENAVSAFALMAWAVVLPWIPWNDDKRTAQDLIRIEGQPIAAVQEIMGNYLVAVTVQESETSWTNETLGMARDLDLASLGHDVIQLYPGFGGVSIYFENGRVSGFGVNDD